MRLRQLVDLLPLKSHLPEAAGDLEITGASADSRQVRPGWLFIAVPGLQVDGHSYIPQAEENGAVALMTEHPVASALPQLIVARTQPLLGTVMATLWGTPSLDLRVTGITGTKGKTSVSYLLQHLLHRAGKPAALIGSVGGRVGGEVLDAGLTTRPAEELQALMRRAFDAGERHWVMEVGSHSLVQRRVAGIDFDTAIFTNLSHDHLDYHGTMDRYLAAKALLFGWLGAVSYGRPGEKGYKLAILNQDDPVSATLREICGVPVLSYGKAHEADLRASELCLGTHGSSFALHWQEQRYSVELPLVGTFNIMNALAAVAGGLAEGLSLEAMIAALAKFTGVPGRFERILQGQPFSVVVDYAHTEESLRQVLATAREMTQGRLILVFGCTGDRDRAKRPLMGALATASADLVIVTSDDPHGEEPDAIIDEIVAGIPASATNWQRQVDRTAAVAAAIEEARVGDFVLLAGKGHEKVQVFKDCSVPYSDQETARQALFRRGYRH